MLIVPKVAEIKKRRENIGLSQDQVSLQAGLTDTVLQYIESGKT